MPAPAALPPPPRIAPVARQLPPIPEGGNMTSVCFVLGWLIILGACCIPPGSISPAAVGIAGAALVIGPTLTQINDRLGYIAWLEREKREKE